MGKTILKRNSTLTCKKKKKKKKKTIKFVFNQPGLSAHIQYSQ